MKPKDDDAAHPVGYGKPPVKNRFQPGMSGNPAGRPKKKREPDLDPEIATAKALFTGKVSAVKDGVACEVPLIEAIDAVVTKAALAGDPASHRLLLKRQTQDRKKKARKAQVAKIRGGVLFVPIAPTSMEEWERIYGEKARGMTNWELK